MTRGRLGAAILVAAGLLIVLASLAGSRARGPSYYSRGHEGLRAGLLYLRGRGYEVAPWERSLAELPAEPGALLLALPLERAVTGRELDRLQGWCESGGSLLLLMGGQGPSLREAQLFTALGLYPVNTGSAEPVGYGEWRRWVIEGELLSPAPRDSDRRVASGVRRARASWRLAPPKESRVRLVDEEGEPALFEFRWRGGRVVVVNDASVMSNGWLSRGGNLALLDDLARSLLDRPAGGGHARTLFVDEWHHGHASAEAGRLDGPRGAVPPVLLYLLLMLGLALWTLSRPLGPPWLPRPRSGVGSESARLISLARLHRQLGHAGEAGAVMIDSARRARRLRGLPAGRDLPRHFTGTEQELLQLGREMAELQREGRL